MNTVEELDNFLIKSYDIFSKQYPEYFKDVYSYDKGSKIFDSKNLTFQQLASSETSFKFSNDIWALMLSVDMWTMLEWLSYYPDNIILQDVVAKKYFDDRTKGICIENIESTNDILTYLQFAINDSLGKFDFDYWRLRIGFQYVKACLLNCDGTEKNFKFLLEWCKKCKASRYVFPMIDIIIIFLEKRSQDIRKSLWSPEVSMAIGPWRDLNWHRKYTYDYYAIIEALQGSQKINDENHRRFLDNRDRYNQLHTLAIGKKWSHNSARIGRLVFSDDSSILATTGSDDKLIKLWDVHSGRLLQTLSGHAESIAVLRFSPDGKILASTSYDLTLKVWDVGTGSLLQTMSGHKGAIECLAFSPDSKLVASGAGSYPGKDGKIKLWNIATGNLIDTFEGHSYASKCLAFHPDGKILASGGSFDNLVKLWDIVTKQVLVFSGHQEAVEFLAYQSGSKILISQDEKKVIGMLDINQFGNSFSEAFSERRNNAVLIQKEPAISRLYNMNGNVAMLNDTEEYFEIIDVVNRQLIKKFSNEKFPRDGKYVVPIWAISSDGKIAVTVSKDLAINFWGTDSGNCIK